MSQTARIGAIWILLGGATVQGQVNYPTFGGVYSQNFNSLSNSNAGNGMQPWTNNITLGGWFAYRSMPGNTNVIGRDAGTWNATAEYRVSAGPGTAGNLFSLGELNESERALGSIAAGSPIGDHAYGVVLRNTTGTELTNFRLSYTGEQWAAIFAFFPHLLEFDFAVSATLPTSAFLSGGNTASYTRVPLLDFAALQNGLMGPENLNGNLAKNRLLGTNGPAGSDFVWPNNQYLVLRWFDDNDDSLDHALALDDLSFVATPEPSSLTLLGVAALALVRRRYIA